MFLRIRHRPDAVGYNTTDGETTVMLGCQFVDVADGESGVLLGDLKGDFEDFDLLEVAECDDSGIITTVAYTYLTEDGSGVDTGWYGDDLVTDVRIPHGAAVWFTSSSGEPKAITISGQVFQGTDGTFTHHFDVPTVMVCSAFPIAFEPNNTEVNTWVGLTDFDLIEVADCDEFGVITTRAYTYLTEDGSGVDTGWYEDDLLEGSIVGPGKGFWLTVSDPGVAKLIEKSPLK